MNLRWMVYFVASLVVIICLGTSGCAPSATTSSPIPTTLPPGLSIEEYALEAEPQLDPLSFTPRTTTQAEVLSKHRGKRGARSPGWVYHNGEWIAEGDDQLKAREVVTTTERSEQGQLVVEPVSMAVDVYRQGKLLYSIPLSPTGAIPPIWGLWAYADRWALEVAHVTLTRIPPNTIDSDEFGEVIQDGVALNEQNGYEESFGFQLLKGKPFYFFKKQGRIGISYDSQEIDLGYTRIPHHGCCSASELNPQSTENAVAFFAQRAGVWYYVEIGVFE